MATVSRPRLGPIQWVTGVLTSGVKGRRG